MAARRAVLVSGANKGIGLGIVQRLLETTQDIHVYLCSRRIDNGQHAVQQAIRSVVDRSNGTSASSIEERIDMVELDVSSDTSVEKAAAEIADKGIRLYGIVNNAGVAFSPFDELMQVNFSGVRRMTNTFSPLLDPEGARIVNVSSAAGPNFVSRCSTSRQQQLVNPDITEAALDDLAREASAVHDNLHAARAAGLANEETTDMAMWAYGLSKALVNAYTQHTARHACQNVVANACTPGWIDTDLAAPLRGDKTPDHHPPAHIHFLASCSTVALSCFTTILSVAAEVGMRTPYEGALAPCHLLLSGDVRNDGFYYGSDAKRSPLHRYRGPGEPAYVGD